MVAEITFDQTGVDRKSHEWFGKILLQTAGLFACDFHEPLDKGSYGGFACTVGGICDADIAKFAVANQFWKRHNQSTCFQLIAAECEISNNDALSRHCGFDCIVEIGKNLTLLFHDRFDIEYAGPFGQVLQVRVLMDQTLLGEIGRQMQD